MSNGRVEFFPGGTSWFSETHKSLLLAALGCKLPAYNPLSGERLLPDESDKRIWTTPQDLNDWLKLNGNTYRFCHEDNRASETQTKNKSEQTMEWETKAREIGEEWMKAERKKGEDPGVIAIANYVEGELSCRNITGARGKFLDAATIKREALKGITGKSANGKRQKS